MTDFFQLFFLFYTSDSPTFSLHQAPGCQGVL